MPRLILFHGLASSPKEFGMLVHPLRRHGVTLLTPSIAGYSHGLLAADVRWQEWVQAARHSLAAELAASPGPYILGGLCSGAMLATAVAEGLQDHPPCGLAMLSPLFAYDGWSLPWFYRLRHLAYLLGLERHFAMHERSPYGLKNERMRQFVRNQMTTGQATLVGPSQVALGHVRESERLSAHVRRLLPRLKLPVLALHARDDEICSLKSVRSAVAAVPAAQLRMQVLDNSFHMITADNDRLEVADALARFARSTRDRAAGGLLGGLSMTAAPAAAT